MDGSSMHRQVFLLASAQALFQTALVMVMTVGGLAGGQITSRPEPQNTLKAPDVRRHEPGKRKDSGKRKI